MFVVLVKPRAECQPTFFGLQYSADLKFIGDDGFFWKKKYVEEPAPVSYLSDLSANMAGGAGPCAFPRHHFIQRFDWAPFRWSVRPTRGQGLERAGDRWRDFTRRWGHGDWTWHLHGNSERSRVCKVGACVNRCGGAAVTELLPLLPLVQLPHHPFLCGYTLVCGHAEVAQSIVGILVVTGQAAGCWWRVAAGGNRRLWQWLIRGVSCACFGL